MTQECGGAPPRLQRDAYARAERFLPWNAAKRVFKTDVTPRWIEHSDRFWYHLSTRNGTEFVLVDPPAGTRCPAFDHARLAAALSAATGTPYTHQHLPFDQITFTEDGQAIEFDVDDGRWSCNLATYTCRRVGTPETPAPDELRSPDECWVALTRDHNLYVRSLATGEEAALTEDGEPGYAYGRPTASPPQGDGHGARDESRCPAAMWSPDSRKLLSHRIDERQADRFHLVQSTPPDGAMRPLLHSYPYPLPGDEHVPLAELIVCDVERRTRVMVDIAPLPMLYYGSPLHPEAFWWSPDSKRVYVLWSERGYLAYTLWDVDATTGAARVVVEERAATGILPTIGDGPPSVRTTGDGAEIIWFSQRDGWGHLYLYDGETGTLKNRITSGVWNVASIVHVDEAARWVYFMALGREAERDPYHAHLYRVHLDGGDPTLLTPEDANHRVAMAPSGRYVVDTYSRVDMPPVTVLRACDGALICELEQADIDLLLDAGWRVPERFRVKARDGVTDVYGVMFRPSIFDPAVKIPVLDNIYAGPQTSHAAASFADVARERPDNFWQAQALAELGFVVVQNCTHGLGQDPYFIRKRWDYFVRHLLGLEPPGYQIQP